MVTSRLPILAYAKRTSPSVIEHEHSAAHLNILPRRWVNFIAPQFNMIFTFANYPPFLPFPSFPRPPSPTHQIYQTFRRQELPPVHVDVCLPGCFWRAWIKYSKICFCLRKFVSAVSGVSLWPLAPIVSGVSGKGILHQNGNRFWANRCSRFSPS